MKNAGAINCWSSTEVAKLLGAEKGYDGPLVLYFNHRGMVKMKLGIAKGKKFMTNAR